MKTRLVLGRDIECHGEFTPHEATLRFKILQQEKVETFVKENKGTIYATKFVSGTSFVSHNVPPKDIEVRIENGILVFQRHVRAIPEKSHPDKVLAYDIVRRAVLEDVLESVGEKDDLGELYDLAGGSDKLTDLVYEKFGPKLAAKSEQLGVQASDLSASTITVSEMKSAAPEKEAIKSTAESSDKKTDTSLASGALAGSSSSTNSERWSWLNKLLSQKSEPVDAPVALKNHDSRHGFTR